MLQIIEGAAAEVFLLTPDRYRWVVIKMLMGETELCDTRDWEGFRGVHLLDEQALLHQPCFDIMHC